jgi:hypothetical protein
VNTLTAVLRSLERHAKHVHSVIFSTNAVTVAMVPAFTNTLIKLQFVLVAFPSVAAVVHSFDITWCMAAFTGTCVYFAQLCCAAMQRGYGIVTSPVRQSCKRIRKYLLRGMPIVTPETTRWKRIRSKLRRRRASEGFHISTQRGHVVSASLQPIAQPLNCYSVHIW